LSNLFTPIAEAGPDQQGFGARELAALNTESGEGVGRNYAKATQSLNTVLGSRGGGNEMLPTGSEGQLRAAMASSAANQMSSEQLGITRANYGQGRENWREATAGLNALGQEYNPNAVAGEATSAGGQAFGEATKVQEMKNQKEMAIAGGITSLAAGVATGGASFLAGGLGNLDTQGTSSGGEQVGNFFSGGFKGLMG
jgi:hypothetical protein